MNQRKHELQRNDLAEWLETIIRSPSTPTVVGVIIAAFVVVFLGIWWFQSSNDARDASWAAHFEAADRAQFDGAVEPLARHAADSGDPLARSWSRQLAADAKLSEGLSLLFNDRAKAKAVLEEAAKGYQEVSSQNQAGSMIHSRAVFGNAIAQEALGNSTEALAGYQAIVDAGPETALGKLAQSYINNLKSIEAPDAFVEKFVAHTPTAPTTPDFNDPNFNPFGPGFETPVSPSGLRSLPDISFPEPLTEPAPGETSTETPAPTEGSTDPAAPGDGTTPESGTPETPADTSPETPPASTGDGQSTPATETPTTETPTTETPSPTDPTTPPATTPPASGSGGEPGGQ